MLQQCARLPDLLPKTKSDIDIREAARFSGPARPKLRVMIRPSFLPVTVAVSDISTKGVGLLCESHIEPGSCLALLWKYGSVDRWRTLRVRVVRLTPRRDGGWVAGCVFGEQLQPADMEAFLKYSLTPNSAESGLED
jgi:hypothetical protein